MTQASTLKCSYQTKEWAHPRLQMRHRAILPASPKTGALSCSHFRDKMQQATTAAEVWEITTAHVRAFSQLYWEDDEIKCPSHKFRIFHCFLKIIKSGSQEGRAWHLAGIPLKHRSFGCQTLDAIHFKTPLCTQHLKATFTNGGRMRTQPIHCRIKWPYLKKK